MTPVLRPAVPTDAATLSAIGAATFVETFGHLYAPADLDAFLRNHTVERWVDELADPRFAVLLAMAGDEAAGFAKLGPPSLPVTHGPRSIELRQFYIRSPWHGTGLAVAMITQVLVTARARGADELYLSVFIDNPRARRFYERHGFERVGRYVFMVGDHEDEDDIMRLAL
ncbi:GNAT family N-acetyltransferase [Sphingomonas sp. CFBP 13720]|uniref:GNAT family N-acetyltransferase n=1 Tax=Sphingomonas sp. CFBP 13720 TaxID=2775302 RepID=UPI00177E6450|nr:GNAT family N-acetyltransferase [Sphingomonas sp. CFBP 13720]MBD8680023.1 GNAT family N-acetyltransferase [Sphingomonas sp. CFBP 13720]